MRPIGSKLIDIRSEALKRDNQGTVSPYLDIVSTPQPKKISRLTECTQDLAASQDSYSLQKSFETREYHIQMYAHAPDHIPIIQGPFHGAKRLECEKAGNGDRMYGYVHVTGEDVEAYEEAREHLSKDPAMRSVLMHLEDGATHRTSALSGAEDSPNEPRETVIKTTKGFFASSGFNLAPFGDREEIQWNTRMGIITDNPEDVSGISPATVLGHECVHRLHFATNAQSFIARLITPAGEFFNREERATVQREAAFAAQVGEGKRKQYDGFPIRVDDATKSHAAILADAQKALAYLLIPLLRFPKSGSPTAGQCSWVMASGHLFGSSPAWHKYAKQQAETLDSSGWYNSRMKSKLLKDIDDCASLSAQLRTRYGDLMVDPKN